MSKHRDTPKRQQPQQTRRMPMEAMRLRLIRCRDSGNAEIIVNLEHLVWAEWITKIPDNQNPKVPIVLPNPVLSLLVTAIRQGSTICRHLHPEDSKWVWSMLCGFAVCGVTTGPAPEGGNGDGDG